MLWPKRIGFLLLLLVQITTVKAFQQVRASYIQDVGTYQPSMLSNKNKCENNWKCADNNVLKRKGALRMTAENQGQRTAKFIADRREMLIMTSLATLTGLAQPAFSRAARSNDGGKWASHFGGNHIVLQRHQVFDLHSSELT
jgi:hypothetical protein